jgi:tetratricopeptide (TPR) repeat protein
VTVGEELELRLPERGWVYLGEDGNREGLSFRRRYTEGDDTVFLFSVDSAGDYMARFQRQDLERGVFGERRVAVDARPEPAAGGGTRVSQMSGEGTGTQTRAAPGGENSAAAPNAAEEEAAGDPSDGAGDSGNAGSSHFGSPSDGESVGSGGLEQAYALLEEGKRERALEAFLQSYPVGDPEVHGTIAELAFELGRYETATSHWMENLDAGAPYEENARLGLFRTALTTGDAETAWEHYGALGGPDVGPGSGPVGAAGEAGRAGAETGGPVAVEPGAADEASGARAEPGAAPISAAELRRLGELLADTENPGRAVAPFEAYLERGGSPEDPATLYFTLGQLYEDRRDARQALVYYRRVVDEYPLSRHWQPAEARVQYLRRHFFDIR